METLEDFLAEIDRLRAEAIAAGVRLLSDAEIDGLISDMRGGDDAAGDH